MITGVSAGTPPVTIDTLKTGAFFSERKPNRHHKAWLGSSGNYVIARYVLLLLTRLFLLPCLYLRRLGFKDCIVSCDRVSAVIDWRGGRGGGCSCVRNCRLTIRLQNLVMRINVKCWCMLGRSACGTWPVLSEAYVTEGVKDRSVSNAIMVPNMFSKLERYRKTLTPERTH